MRRVVISWLDRLSRHGMLTDFPLADTAGTTTSRSGSRWTPRGRSSASSRPPSAKRRRWKTDSSLKACKTQTRPRRPSLFLSLPPDKGIHPCRPGWRCCTSSNVFSTASTCALQHLMSTLLHSRRWWEIYGVQDDGDSGERWKLAVACCGNVRVGLLDMPMTVAAGNENMMSTVGCLLCFRLDT